MLHLPTRLLSILMVLTMVFALAACQSAPPGEDAGAAPAAKDPAPAADTKKDDAAADTPADAPQTSDLPFVTITHYATGDANPNGQVERVAEEWNKLLKDRVNAELVQQWISWADFLTKYNLLLASADTTIDLFEASSTWLELWQNADRGAWLPLDDLLPEYAPLTWNDIPADVWDECKFRGEIVCIPENDYTQYVNHGIMYRGDWAVEAGLPQQLTTIEQFEEYGDYIKANKPGVFPLDVANDFNFFSNWVKIHTDYIPILGVNEVVQGASLSDPYTAASPVFEDVALLWAQDMKRWGDKGFWREDVLNNTASVRDSFKSGTSGVDLHHVQTHRGLKWEMENKFFPGEAVQEILLWCDLDGGELIQDPINTHGAMCVYAYSANPERALMVYDLIRNDQEMYQLFNWGIQGVHWDVDDEGYKIKPEGYDDSIAFGTNFWGGRVDRFEYPSREEWDGIYDYWKRLDGIVVPNPYSQFVFDKSAVDAELSAMTAVIAELRAAISTGKAGDPVAAIENYRNKLSAAGYDKYIAEVQRQLDEYKVYKEGQ